MPLKNTTGLEYRPLIRSVAWRKRRQKIIARAGRSSGVQSPLNDIQPVCKSARYVPCRQKKKVLAGV